MTSGLSIELVGDDAEVNAMLTRIDTALSPVAMAAFLGLKVGVYLKERATSRFGNEGDDVSGKWAPLLPQTQIVRASGNWPVGATHPINKRTSELEDYIVGSDIFAGSYAGGSMVTYPGKAPSTVGLQEKVTTAQKGRSHPKTVARPVLGINERDALYILTELAFYVGGVKKP